MKVSLLMPTYNGVRFLKRAIDSIKAQTYKNWELVIGDDCSDDGTWELIKSLSQRHKKIVVFQNTHRLGTVKNRKACYEKSTGDLIGHFDQDDMLERYSLEEMVLAFKTNSQTMLIYSDIVQIGPKNEVQLYSASKDFNPKALFDHGWRHLGMYRREVMSHIAGYNDRLVQPCEDGDLFMQIAEKGMGIYRLPKPLYLYRATESNQSHNRIPCTECQQRSVCNYIRVWDKAVKERNT